MLINNINPYQGMQNAIRPGGSNTSSADNRMVLSAGRTSTVLLAEKDSYDPQLLKISERITTLQRNLDLTLVHYPPFFPIATYQRADMIVEMKGIGEAIEQADINPALTQAAAVVAQLSSESNDADIAGALDKLLMVRDTLVRERAQSQKDVQPGSILELEI